MEVKMNVKLISYSQQAIDADKQDEFEFDLPNLQDLVAYCARVSNPSNQANSETSEKLIKYLIKHKHWSPLEMVSACMEIETTRDIARQLLRHRSFSFQEFSQRYADPTAELDDAFVLREARMQDTKNRQNSVELDMSDENQKLLAYEWERAQKRVLYAVKKEYEWAIKNGIAKEQARAV
jgi:thymidylate synthase (FAD)